jgi:signal transduction histidine kinase/DNA-binding response OmpR family regulator
MLINSRQFDVELLTQLRNKIYIALLILLISLSSMAVMLGDLVGGTSLIEFLGIWWAILVICVVSYQLRDRSRIMSNYALFAGLLIVFASVARTAPPDFLLSIIPIFLPVATLLFGRRSTFILTVITILTVLMITPINGDIKYLLPQLLIVGVAFLTTVITFEGFYELLVVMQDYQHYALHQMREARESRAILAQRTKNLAEATENLSYANRQLRIAKGKIEEAHKLKAQFAANVSHELRTPINLVVGFAEAIVRFPDVYDTPLPPAYLSDIRTIYRNGKHLQSLINDVLDISQIESGHMAVVKEEASMLDIIHEAANMMRDQITNTGLDFIIDVSDNLPILYLDRLRIRQVFINLLGNAIRFTDVGKISVTAYRDEDNILICVADTGIGIVPSEAEHIFEEFYQTDSINRRGEGSGLGLTLSRQFVRMHNGEIWVESDGVVDYGSQFWIKLPFETQSRLVQAGEVRTLSTERKTVLVLNDDSRVIDFFDRHMNKQQVIGVESLNDLVNMVEINHSALVLDIDDFETLKDAELIDKIQKQLPIVSCSMPSGRRYMKELGVADYLIKPVSVDTLKQSINQFTSEPKHILIVDDEKEIVRLFGRLLKAILPQCNLTMAYSGQEALALLEIQQPDLVILDILMPDVDGLTVLKIIKTSTKLAHIPVIIASAKGATEAISTSDDGRLYVQKPTGFQPLELINCIENIIEHLTPLTENIV